MSKVEQIKASIETLTLEERVELAALLASEFPDDDWDRQMKAAARTSRFDALNTKTDAVARGGRGVKLGSCASE